MKHVTLICLFALFASAAFVAGEKTSIVNEQYIEDTEVDFALHATISGITNKVYTFSLDADGVADCTLVCFIDGLFWETQAFEVPGIYNINFKGLSTGQHVITLQLVDQSSRVGKHTEYIIIN